MFSIGCTDKVKKHQVYMNKLIISLSNQLLVKNIYCSYFIVNKQPYNSLKIIILNVVWFLLESIRQKANLTKINLIKEGLANKLNKKGLTKCKFVSRPN